MLILNKLANLLKKFNAVKGLPFLIYSYNNLASRILLFELTHPPLLNYLCLK